MSNIEKFEELLRTDEDLQAKLRAAQEAFEGDAADEDAVFDAIIAPLAASLDLPFTFEELKEHAENGAEISDDNLDAIAGGSFCFIIGGSEYGNGTGACSGDEAVGATACFFLGVGMLGVKADPYQ